MQAPPEPIKKAQDQSLQTDETLKERFGKTPIFPDKIEKATRIMTLVRQKQGKR